MYVNLKEQGFGLRVLGFRRGAAETAEASPGHDPSPLSRADLGHSLSALQRGVEKKLNQPGWRIKHSSQGTGYRNGHYTERDGTKWEALTMPVIEGTRVMVERIEPSGNRRRVEMTVPYQPNNRFSHAEPFILYSFDPLSPRKARDMQTHPRNSRAALNAATELVRDLGRLNGTVVMVENGITAEDKKIVFKREPTTQRRAA
jgi:hypothetical protein